MDRLRLSGREVAFYAHDEDGDGLEAAQLFSRGLLRDGGTAADAAHPSAEELAFWRAAGRRLLACLDELPDDQRAAFLLHHEDGFTIEAMAETLDVGFETVRSRLRYGAEEAARLHGALSVGAGAARMSAGPLTMPHAELPMTSRSARRRPAPRAGARARPCRGARLALAQGDPGAGARRGGAAETRRLRPRTGLVVAAPARRAAARMPWNAAFATVLVAPW